ncbi:MAG: DUF3616 domain-containing protein [Xanthobacteraceae bacterium]
MPLACTVLAALLALLPFVAFAGEEALQPVAAWSVRGNFEKGEEARTNLSGAACTTRAPPFRSCLIVNDQKNYAQFFHVDGTKLIPGAVVRLRDGGDGDPDLEGAAYDSGFFYAIGSHGRTRWANKPNDTSYAVFRFPVRKSGKPKFAMSENSAAGVQSSERLRAAIRDAEGPGAFYDKPLAQNGVNIEGIAVKDGRMHLGFRGPSVEGRGFILSADADAVFGKKTLRAKVHALPLGATTGIRDLAAVRDGVLILTGPVNDQPVTPAVFLWNQKTGALKKLGALAIPEEYKKHKAETLLVLRDEKNKPYRVLVMFDGPENGGPTEYEIPR